MQSIIFVTGLLRSRRRHLTLKLSLTITKLMSPARLIPRELQSILTCRIAYDSDERARGKSLEISPPKKTGVLNGECKISKCSNPTSTKVCVKNSIVGPRQGA